MIRTLFIATAMVLVTRASVEAGGATLVSSALDNSGGAVTCHVVNVNKKSVALISVEIVPATGGTPSSANCVDVAPGTACPVTIGLGSPGTYYCRVTTNGGNKKNFRADFCDVTTGNCSELR